MKGYQTKKILGARVADVSVEDIVTTISALIKENGKKTFFGVNAHNMNVYKSDKEYKKAMDNATLIYPEGMSIILASKILGNPLYGKTTLMDFIFDIVKTAEKNKWPVYILGGTKTVSQKARESLKKRMPKLVISTHHGYFSDKENKSVIADINKRKPVILFVAMGTPRQEIWIDTHKDSVNAKAFFGIGGSIDVLAGKMQRSPAWMHKNGLEWAYRFWKEPKRLGKRYIIGNTRFMLSVFSELIHEAH